MPDFDEDFVGELLGSRTHAALASKIYRLGDGLRTVCKRVSVELLEVSNCRNYRRYPTTPGRFLNSQSS